MTAVDQLRHPAPMENAGPLISDRQSDAGEGGLLAAGRAAPTGTSAFILRSMVAACVGVGVFSGDPGTSAGYARVVPSMGTGSGGHRAAGTALQLRHARDRAPAVLELHRLSGLTFEELADMLGVTRRSLHHWANGRRIGGGNEVRLYRLLATVQRMDRGEATLNRRLLRQPDERGETLFGLLKAGRVEEAERAAGRGPGRVADPSLPLSRDAWAARQPPPPAELLGASREAIATPGRRLLRAKRLVLPRGVAKA